MTTKEQPLPSSHNQMSAVHDQREQQVMGVASMLVRIMVITFAALATFILADGANIHTVVASALIGLFGSFLPRIGAIPAPILHGDVFIGSFAGMCSGSIILGMNEVLALGVMAGGVTVIVGSWLTGLGGRLGSIAFIASVVSFGEITLW